MASPNEHEEFESPFSDVPNGKEGKLCSHNAWVFKKVKPNAAGLLCLNASETLTISSPGIGSDSSYGRVGAKR